MASIIIGDILYRIIQVYVTRYHPKENQEKKEQGIQEVQMVVLINGILWISMWFREYQVVETTLISMVLSVLLAVTIVDYKTKHIPNLLVVLILILSGVANYMIDRITLQERIIGVLIIAIPMLLIAFITAGKFGGGDIKLVSVLGAVFGYHIMIRASFVGLMLALIVGGYYKLIARRRQEKIALGPWISLGIYLVIILQLF